MSIKLFEHNQSAYESVLEMLSDEGKATVVHPTGTGKSYIGFKLCEQFPDKIVCWLSPSEYIFNTQLENLKQDSDGWQPENITFFTYAKLMLMTDSELAAINPDYIVLDEFHRCGAEMWGEGIDRLLSMYPDTPILGLSATAIRYLDNQRNMADELFDGNIASEMTLGEAIVRGILNPPKYVMSVFAYQEDYNRLKRRVRRAKSKAVRDSAERYLEALRRALEMADGLDKVFDKHMENRTGKYIVFCSNIEHLREMQSKAKEWFGKIDSEPHIYTAYSEDPTTSKEFQNFKQDDSNHLKLLYAIDMLNEGIHVDDVSGVILFRPTVSPIIYKQQIGRALAAGKNNVPVIFDIVNNIENLYSIGTIQQEMQVAISYYRSHGMDSYIVNDRFEVIDEVREAKQLFDTLNDTLSASWDVMFSYAEQYYHEHGNLEVPRRYKTDDGYSLGNWIFTQRKVYAGESYGCLDEQRIKKLENIGMVWNSTRDLVWERNYNAAQTYYENNGNLYVPVDYVTDDGIKLGVWLSNLRTYRKNDNHKALLTPDRLKQLEAIGMIWDVPDYLWQQNYNALLDYYRSHGNIDVPKGYITEDGIKLYQWLLNVKQAYRRTDRKGYRLTNSQIQQLEKLGVDWRTRSEIAFEAGLSHAKDYFSENRNLDVPVSYKSPDGYKLGGWISDQKEKFAAGKLTQDKIEALEQVGMVWEKPDPWEERFALAKQYFVEHGDLEVPAAYTVDGVWLAKWIDEQRQINNGKRKGKTLTDDQICRLDEIRMRWGKKKDIQWRMQFDDVKEYYEKHGNLDIPKDYVSEHGKKTAQWLERQRKAYAMDELSDEQIKMLDSVGFIELCEVDDSWELMYPAAKAYYAEHGDLLIPTDYVTDSGLNLGFWISNMRACYKKKKRTRYFTEERIKQLEAIGIFNRLVEPFEQRKILQNAERKNKLQSTGNNVSETIEAQGNLQDVKDFFRAYKDFTDQQLDTIEILLMKLYARFGITDATDYTQKKPSDFPIMKDLYEICEEEFKTFDSKRKHIYTEQTLQEVCLGLHSMCVGAESKYFNGHTNITDDTFLCFGVKGLLDTNRRLKDAMLFNILSYMSNKLLGIGNTVASIDELYLFLSNRTAIEYIRNAMKRVRKKESSVILASQNIEDFLLPDIKEFTKPLFSIPTHHFLFYPGNINAKDYEEALMVEPNEYQLIRFSSQGTCLYRCGNERYLLQVIAPKYKSALFGKAGGR